MWQDSLDVQSSWSETVRQGRWWKGEETLFDIASKDVSG